MKKYIVLFLLLGFVSTISPQLVQACSPAQPLPIDELIGKSDVIFYGKAVDVKFGKGIRGGYETNFATTTFEVANYWKGNVNETAYISDSYIAGYSCSPWSGQKGTDYVIFASQTSIPNVFQRHAYYGGVDEVVKKLGQAKMVDESLKVASTPTPEAVPTILNKKSESSFLGRIFNWLKNLF